MMHRHHRVITVAFFVTMILAAVLTLPANAANSFADPAFQAQWQQGEAITPNFWGTPGQAKTEQYEYSGTNHTRLVQYFDKGRMERYDGVTNQAGTKVTNGLLAKEMLNGSYQIGDDQYVPKPSPKITIAGDPGTAGPSFDTINTTAAVVIYPADPVRVGTGDTDYLTIQANGNIANQVIPSNPAIAVSAYDGTTKHNVAKAFATYRTKAGLPTIGLALSEPFYATVPVAGMSKLILIQVFERRVLTYTASNPDGFEVEMGNVGQIYYQWRYGSSPAASAPTTPAPAAASATDPGTLMTLASTGFLANELVTLSENLPDGSIVNLDNTYALTADRKGSITVTVPALTPGPYTLTAKGIQSGFTISKQFKIY